MSEFTTWQRLNEALGFPLGVTSSSGLGLLGQALANLEEGKMKKKMDDEVEVKDEIDSDDDDKEDKKEDGKDEVPHKGRKVCTCDKPEPRGFMCKKCNKGMAKYMKNMNENAEHDDFDVFASYETAQRRPRIDKNSPEYRAYFFKSIASCDDKPYEKRWGGVNLGEEVLFSPPSETPVAPSPGEVGSAPVTAVGANHPDFAGGEVPEWEKHWVQISESFNPGKK